MMDKISVDISAFNGVRKRIHAMETSVLEEIHLKMKGNNAYFSGENLMNNLNESKSVPVFESSLSPKNQETQSPRTSSKPLIGDVQSDEEDTGNETKAHPNVTSMVDITTEEYNKSDCSSVCQREVKIPRRNFGPSAAADICADASGRSIEATQSYTGCNNNKGDIITHNFREIPEFITNARSELDNIMVKLEHDVDKVIALRTICDAKKNSILELLNPGTEFNMINYNSTGSPRVHEPAGGSSNPESITL
uniref:Uncharacterized protein n=1 Tax=Aplanochytrium stocchinoi TaxID=215587 RepID=A0A7S3PDZ3_9STRA|mmetsp:Transcript_35324/g.43600  ORF Transcript_35324/g.43600 Transcript_35324/m.43600 type:complete len:251 (+) Transcript_35324:248-1000(+)